MAISASVQCLGLTVVAAVLLQTIAVAVSFMYFNKVLNTVRVSLKSYLNLQKQASIRFFFPHTSRDTSTRTERSHIKEVNK